MQANRYGKTLQFILAGGISTAAGLAVAQAQTWGPLASEGASFTVSGTQTVRYGAGTSWIQKSVTASGNCTNAFFGLDPLPNTVKSCQLLTSAPATASPGTGSVDMLGEWANCQLPEQIVFVREPQGVFWPAPMGVTRKEKYAGKALETKAAKNPENHDAFAPAHTQNCTPGTAAGKNTQWVTFKLRTANYFGNGTTNALSHHLAVFLRGKWGPPGGVSGSYGRTDYIAAPQYHGRGIAMFQDSGVQGEHFSIGQPSGRQTMQTGGWSRLHPLVLRDGVTYTVNVIASDTSVSYQVVDPGNNGNNPSIYWSSASSWYEVPNDIFVPGGTATNARTTGTGFGVVPLCNFGPGAGCHDTYDTRTFTVEMTEISGGWF